MRMESFRACAIVLSAMEEDNDWVIMAHCLCDLTQLVGLESWAGKAEAGGLRSRAFWAGSRKAPG